LLGLVRGDEPGFLGEQELFDALASIRLQLLDDELRRGQYGQSLVVLNRWIQRYPKRPDLLHYRGETLRLRNEAGDLESARQDFEAALASPDALSITHRSMGNLWRAQTQPLKAREAFQRYLDTAPTASDAELIRAEINALN
jgi:beta-barrel assembly-enhancing protease